MIIVLATPVAAFYVFESFLNPNPVVRIVLRTLPVLPAAMWTLWFDRSRPLERWPAPTRSAARLLLLLVIMIFAIAVLGLGINWLYDPNRIL